jgi:phosphoribosyl-AMP cyclohydrolase
MERAARAFFATRCCERATIVAWNRVIGHDWRLQVRHSQHHSKESGVSDESLSVEERENGTRFVPKFDRDGLLTAVVVDDRSGEVLVVAHMNRQALDHTLDSGKVTFWSRSRQSLWTKGETSGNILTVSEVLVDCDQDALVIRAQPAGPTCHTGAKSCFYRRVERGNTGPVLVKVKT